MRLRLPREGRRWWVRVLPLWALCGGVLWVLAGSAAAQSTERSAATYRLRAGRFLAGRGTQTGSVAAALDQARRQHRALLALPRVTALSTPWQAVGPGQVASQAYGAVTGRVTAVAIDPADATGNTVYVGTTGGGVWKSGNAGAPASDVSFAPLTDTIPAFGANAGTSAIPSLSIGALSVRQYLGQDVILAGTGDPNDATDSYYGSGILRSADGGNTWALIQESVDGVAGNHSFFGLGFAGFAWSSTTPGLVVAALSQAVEGVIVNAPDDTNSVMGLYYSTDAGVTWQMATIKDGSQVVQQPSSETTGGSNAATAVAWNPVRQMFYAAVRFHGYYQSADGVTWTRMAAQPGTGLTTTACPPEPNGTGSTNCPIFRGALAVQPASGDTFAFTVDINNVDQGIWRDVCGQTGSSCAAPAASFGTRLPSTALETNGEIPQGDYDLTLAAVASGTDTLVFAGTVDLYRCSLASGCVFRNTTNTGDGCTSPALVSPAQHAVATLAGAGQTGLPLVYVGNDGGLWRSLDGVNEQGSPCAASDASHFENLNGGLGSLAEVVSFAQHPNDANTLLVGLGATGTAATSSAATNAAWPQLAQGEGGVVAIDPLTPANWYISTGAGVNISYCGEGAACGAADFAGPATIGATQVANDAALVDAAWMLDPAATAEVLVGTCRAWRGTAASGALWTTANAISGDFGVSSGGALTASCDDTDPLVRSLAAGGATNTGGGAIENQGSEVLYAGIAGALDGGNSFAGHVFSTTAANTASDTTVWTDLAESPVVNDMAVDGGVFNPGGFDISSLVADTHDATGATVYATVMGFAGNGFNAPHVYRSVDGGAHWTNISSNLPNAPANSVIIDPNDANTLYVAMDTGVYVTSTVTSCASVNCWSPLGAGLPNAPVVELAAAAAMPTGDGRFGELRAATYGRGIWEIPLLTASTPVQPAMTLSPTALSFTAQSVGSASAAQTITVTNTGTAALDVSSILTTGDFNETDSCVGASVAVNQSCTVEVQFLPTAVGARTGVLTVYGNVAGGQATANLSGTGSAEATIVLDPLSAVFGPTTIGATSPALNITVSNLGETTASLGMAVVTGDFRISANSCGSSLATQVGCTVSIVFAPTASGARNGSFSITDSAGTQTATLRGTGTAPATDALAPLTLSFGPQQLTTASATQTMTLTNAGDAALTLIAATITSGDFTAVNSCGNSLNGHSSCTLAVAFVPKQLGQETGTLTVSDQFRSQIVMLNGIGTAPPGVSLAPIGTVAFAATGVGQSSPLQMVTLTNNGDGVLGVAAVAVTGDFQIPAGGNGCGATLALGAACGIQVVFSPTASGARTGTLTVIDSAGSSPQIEALTGTGIDFTLSPDGSTDVTVAGGGSAVYPLLLSSAAGVPGTATLSCAGAPANTTCVVQPATAALGTTTVITVTVATTQTAATSEASLDGTRRFGEWLAVLLPFGLLGCGRSRVRWARALGACVVACLLGMGGCGTGRLIPASELTITGAGGPGTPTGTDTLTVSATSAGLTRSVSLTLVVQ
jgi:Transmembrane protein 131-like N-terminal